MNFRSNINPKNILESFKKWFKENESNLIWNKQAQGYDSNNNIYLYSLNLSVIPIQFNIIKGNFSCSWNNIKSLEGSPRKIKGYFDCSNNKLKSLKGSPKEIGENFYCYYNQLTSLKGCSEKVGENFYCNHNNLDINEFVRINCKKFICDDYYKQSETYKYWDIKNKLKNL